VYFFARWVAHGRPRAAFGTIVSLAAATQLHFSSGCLLAAMLAVCLAYRPRLRLRPTVLGLIVATALYAPYFVHLWQASALDLRMLAGIAGRRSPGHQTFGGRLIARSKRAGKAAHLVWGSANDDGFNRLSPRPDKTPRWALVAKSALSFSECLALLGAVVLLAHQTFGAGYRGVRRGRTALILLAWLLSPVYFFFLVPAWLERHYVIVCYPAQFLAIGMLLDSWMRAHPRHRWFLWGWVALIIAAQASSVIAFQNMVERSGGGAGEYGVSLGAKRKIARRLAELGAGVRLIPANMPRPERAAYDYLYWCMDNGTESKTDRPIYEFHILPSNTVDATCQRLGRPEVKEDFGLVSLLLYRRSE